MRRILFVDHTPFIGGGQLALVQHIAHLDRSRFDPIVACTEEAPELVERFREARARVRVLPMQRLRGGAVTGIVRMLASAVQLRRLIRDERPDLVVSNTTRAAYVASLALIDRKVPLIWWVRDFDYGRQIFRSFGRVPARVLCVSRAIREHYGGTSERFPVVPVGNDLIDRLSTYTDEDIFRVRAQWGFGPDDTIVGFMGRLVEGKGPQDVLTAMEQVIGLEPSAGLLFVGSGEGQEGSVETEIRRAARVSPAAARIALAGFQMEEALYYRSFDIFVHASRFKEAMPTSVIQAMMAGKPVIATATGGTPEVVDHGVTGILVPPGDPGAIAEAVRGLLADPGERQRLGMRGREHALRNHREETTTACVEMVYDEVLGSAGEPTLAQPESAAEQIDMQHRG